MPFARRKGWRKRTVRQALLDGSWLHDIIGGLPVVAALQILQLLHVLTQFALTEQEDRHCWTSTASGIFSTKSTYERYFTGGILFEPHRRLWKTWAPLKVKLFIWLAIWNRCWTVDRPTKRGLPHPDRCLLCDQELEDIDHLLLRCSFSRQIWHQCLRWASKQQLAPSSDDLKFSVWWRRAAMRVDRESRKGINTLVQLVTWCSWKHQNRCLFDGASPSVQQLLEQIRKEARLWVLAGARNLGRLW